MSSSIVHGQSRKWEHDKHELTLRINGFPVASVKNSVHGFYFHTTFGALQHNSAFAGQYYSNQTQACGAAVDWLNTQSVQ